MPRHLEFLEGCALRLPRQALRPPSLATNSINQKLFFSLSLWLKNNHISRLSLVSLLNKLLEFGSCKGIGKLLDFGIYMSLIIGKLHR